MQILADHRMEFEIEGNGNIEIPPIPNPSYIYNEGDTFKLYNLLSEKKEVVATFIVVKVEHELFDIAVGEQVIICYVRKVG